MFLVSGQNGVDSGKLDSINNSGAADGADLEEERTAFPASLKLPAPQVHTSGVILMFLLIFMAFHFAKDNTA